MIMPMGKDSGNTRSDIAYPEWKPNDKSGSLKKFRFFLQDLARTVYLEDHYHADIIFTFQEDGVGREMFTVEKDQTKEEVRGFMRKKVRQSNLYAVIHSFVMAIEIGGRRMKALIVSTQSKEEPPITIAAEIGKDGSVGMAIETELVDPVLGNLFKGTE